MASHQNVSAEFSILATIMIILCNVTLPIVGVFFKQPFGVIKRFYGLSPIVEKPSSKQGEVAKDNALKTTQKIDNNYLPDKVKVAKMKMDSLPTQILPRTDIFQDPLGLQKKD